MKTNFRKKLTDFVHRRMPPGSSVTPDVTVFCLLTGGSLLRSLLVLPEYYNAYTNLFRETLTGERVLREGAMMPAFSVLANGVLAGFTFTAAVMLVFLCRNLLTFYQGSRSIYLMRRLPDAWELPRRTAQLPLCGATMAVLTAFLTYGVLYAVYMGITPPECLPPIDGFAFTAFFGFRLGKDTVLCLKYEISRKNTAPRRRWTMCRCPSPAGRSSVCSEKTARARPRL